jgi:hypothetical protein
VHDSALSSSITPRAIPSPRPTRDAHALRFACHHEYVPQPSTATPLTVVALSVPANVGRPQSPAGASSLDRLGALHASALSSSEVLGDPELYADISKALSAPRLLNELPAR